MPFSSLMRVLVCAFLIVGANLAPAAGQVISSVTGCPGTPYERGTTGCVGGMWLTIAGSGFSVLGRPFFISLRVNKAPYDPANSNCTKANGDDMHLYCELPQLPGTGKLLPVDVLGQGGQYVGFLDGVMYAGPSSSSSSSGGNVDPPTISRVSGCPTVSAAIRTTSDCDGSGGAVLTIAGQQLGPAPTVRLQGLFAHYPCLVDSAQSSDSLLVCSSLYIDASDVNRTLALTVSTVAGSSGPWTVVFASSSSDALMRVLGLSLTAFIAVVVVVVVVLLVLVLCALSCLCGVSFAFLRCLCCCGSRNSSEDIASYDALA